MDCVMPYAWTEYHQLRPPSIQHPGWSNIRAAPSSSGQARDSMERMQKLLFLLLTSRMKRISTVQNVPQHQDERRERRWRRHQSRLPRRSIARCTPYLHWQSIPNSRFGQWCRREGRAMHRYWTNLDVERGVTKRRLTLRPLFPLPDLTISPKRTVRLLLLLTSPCIKVISLQRST